MVFWNKADFTKLNRLTVSSFFRKVRILAFLDAMIAPLIKIQNETLYTMQHDGRKIYLEKVLNDYYQIVGYNPSTHDSTKKIYIENAAQLPEVFVFQPLENSPVFLGDSTNSNEVFLTQEDESLNAFSFTIFIPDTITFDEQDLRAVIDKYAYIGKLYNIETYTI